MINKAYRISKRIEEVIHKRIKKRQFNSYVLGVVLDYSRTTKHDNLDVKRSEVEQERTSPLNLYCKETELEEIETVCEDINRSLSEYIHMCLIDFVKRGS